MKLVPKDEKKRWIFFAGIPAVAVTFRDARGKWVRTTREQIGIVPRLQLRTQKGKR